MSCEVVNLNLSHSFNNKREILADYTVEHVITHQNETSYITNFFNGLVASGNDFHIK